jgi:hypothetical protein
MTTLKAARTRWSAKKKAQVLTVGTIIFLMLVIILLPHALAYTDKYYIDYSQGQTKANDKYSTLCYGYRDYKLFCPTNDAWTQANGPHGSNFCAGFIDRYNAQWTTLAPNFMQQQ